MFHLDLPPIEDFKTHSEFLIFMDKGYTMLAAGIAGACLYHGGKLPARVTARIIKEHGLKGDIAQSEGRKDFNKRMHTAYAILQANRELHLRLTRKLLDNGTVKFDDAAIGRNYDANST